MATSAKLERILEQWTDKIPVKKDPLVGKRFREYTILECIGEGGYAKVYKVRHELLDDIRAIKILNPQAVTSVESKSRFMREAKLLIRLRNRHVVSVHDFGTLGTDILFMVMEYLDGETLRRRLRRKGRLPVDEVLLIAKQVAIGLCELHKQGITHRDLCPENVMLVYGDETIAKIIDFGVAKTLTIITGGKQTDPMKFLGKPEYCSPEQIPTSGNPVRVDARSDVYSLGIMLYELLSGHRPFDASTPHGCMAKHLSEDAVPFSEYDPDLNVPTDLERLVFGLLEKDRANRPWPREMLSLLIGLRREKPIFTPA